MSYLYDMKTETQNFAEIISESLHVETEIIDEEWQVVGATSGVFYDPFREWNEYNSHITRHVFDTGRPILLSDPGQNPLCSGCLEKNLCFYKAGLYYPILLENHCYGVISLAAFNEEQKKNLTENSYPFMRFTGKMAEILASRIRESIIAEKQIATNEYLNTIIASVHEGIIACDADGKITCFNQTAEEKLGISSTAAAGRPVEEILPGSLLARALKSGASIYEKSIQYRDAGGKPIHLISNVTLVRKSDQLLGAVESFNTDESLFRIAQRLLQNDGSAAFHNIIGESQALREVKLRAGAIAKGPSTVLLTGESGTGKELFARAIHNASLRAEFPFIPINCSAIPDALLESELFGYESGAFTGARASGKPGIFELAKGGTIFLDEIGDMPLNLQAKLLRVLQERKVQHIGGTKAIPIDVRVIAATHQDLREKIEEGRFREDLYYRLNVIPLDIPPLRSRVEDIPALVRFFCSKYASILNREITGITDDALFLLQRYSWPGNVRELENAIEYAINYSLGSSVIKSESLPAWLHENGAASGIANGQKKIWEEEEKKQLQSLLTAKGRSLQAKKEIAARLGISLATLYRKLKKYQLS